MSPVRVWGIVLAVALSVPLASAAPAEGQLEVAGMAGLAPQTSLTAGTGELVWDAASLPTVTIRAERVDVERWGVSRVVVANPLGSSPGVDRDDIDERGSHASATVTLAPGRDAQLLVARASSLDATLGASTLRPVAFAMLAAPSPTAARCFDYRACLATSGTYEVGATGLDANLSGDVLMLLRGPIVTVTDDVGERVYASGASESSTGPATTQEDAWVVLRMTGATVTVSTLEAARLYAAAPRLSTSEVDLDDASGTLSIGARRYVASAASDVAAAGLIVLEPMAVAPGLADTQRLVAYAPAFDTTVRGDIQSINLNAVPIYADKPAETAGALVGIVALLGAALYFWPALKFHAMSAMLPLYSRLSKPDILDNDVRNAIYEIIRANPGISARAVHRMSEQSWGTVVYHLRQLERHHVVVSRALGRTRNYYENHGKYRGMEAQLACLQSDRARALARLVASSPGITQETLAEQSGYPQPTTSYYVRKLKAAGLVEEAREGRYVRYQPHAELPRFLEIAESQGAAAPDAAAAPAPAQA